MSCASVSVTRMPCSASSIAGASTCSNVIVPQRSSSTYQASTTPGVVADRSVSLTGISPFIFSRYQSMVASLGAVPAALIEKACFARAS